MDVDIFVRTSDSSRHIVQRISDEETVEDTARTVASRCGFDRVELILAGAKLGEELRMSDVIKKSGPVTCIIARSDRKKKCATEAVQNSSAKPSFFVFCKNCDTLRQGCLRVRCSICASPDIDLHREPTSWQDVLERNRMSANCSECGDVSANFQFKCFSCAEVAAALRHIRNWRPDDECCICGENERSGARNVVDFGCRHSTCLDCFVHYTESLLERGRSGIPAGFVLDPRHGYVMTCPVLGCPARMLDAHHVQLAGRELYDVYHDQAVAAFLDQTLERRSCPHCAATFLLGQAEEEDNEHTVSCPHCSRLSCLRCSQPECVCEQRDADRLASLAVIKTISKPCPKCQVATERAGGCAHIHCTQCGTHWCHVCGGLWGDDCQEAHWFEN